MRQIIKEEVPELELAPEAGEAAKRLAQVYLENVPPAYLHMAVAIRNLQRFTQDELRAELERRDESPAFPDPSKLQEELEQLEDAALEAARETLAAKLAADELAAFERLEQFEDEEPSELEHDLPNELELDELDHAPTEPPPPSEPDDRAVIVDDPPPEDTEE